jgi:ZIP family zinc transporter
MIIGGLEMLNALIWGLIANSSLILGGLIGSWFTLTKRTLGIILAFGAGTLFSAVAYELVFESVRMAKGSGFTAIGFFSGALVFFLMDTWLEKISGGSGEDNSHSGHSRLIIPMVLGIVLDGIPESAVIGIGLLEDGVVSLAILIAIFLSGGPEAIAGTAGMKSAGWSRPKIFGLWFGICIVLSLSTVAGYSLFGNAPVFTLQFINSFAGGAILMMLTNSMIPESYECSGKLAGLFTVLGFALSVLIIILEHP